MSTFYFQLLYGTATLLACQLKAQGRIALLAKCRKIEYMSQSIDAAIEQFLGKLHTRTARNYRIYLERLVSIAQIQSVSDITPASIQSFRDQLRQKRTNRGATMAAHTINLHLIAIRSLLNYLGERNVPALKPDAVSLLPTPVQSPPEITARQIRTLRAAPEQHARSEMTALRDALLLELLLTTGMKVSEIVSLTRQQVSADRRVVTIRGLRDANRNITLSHHARKLIDDYLMKRRDGSVALFVRHDKATTSQPAALTPRSIQRMIHKYARAAGLPPDTSPETLRQQYAQHMAQQGEDIETIREQLGLARTATTRRYLRN